MVDARPKPRFFEEESVLFKSIDESLSEAFIDVYAPVMYDSPNDKERLLNLLDEPITEAVAGFYSKGGDDADP